MVRRRFLEIAPAGRRVTAVDRRRRRLFFAGMPPILGKRGAIRAITFLSFRVSEFHTAGSYYRRYARAFQEEK